MTTENKDIQETKRLLQGLAERIFQTQCEVGLWDAGEVKQDSGSVMLDFLLLNMHAKLSAIYQLEEMGMGSLDEMKSATERDEVSKLLVECAVELLGTAQMRTAKAGEMLLNTVVVQARAAREMQAELPVDSDEESDEDEDEEASPSEDILQAAIRVANASQNKRPNPPTE